MSIEMSLSVLLSSIYKSSKGKGKCSFLHITRNSYLKIYGKLNLITKNNAIISLLSLQKDQITMLMTPTILDEIGT